MIIVKIPSKKYSSKNTAVLSSTAKQAFSWVKYRVKMSVSLENNF